MVCANCERRIADCDCQKNNELVKHWPKNTWFQQRLKKVKIAEVNGKENTRDAGYALLNVLLFMVVAGAIILALVTFSYVGRQAIENLQSIGRCIEALLECRTI